MKAAFLLTSVGLLALSGCQSMTAPKPTYPTAHVPVAKAMLNSTSNAAKPLAGEVYFAPDRGGVLVTAKVTGLAPHSTNAIHLHQNASCENNGDAAGGHFNPFNTPHGDAMTPNSHAGDLPNITADANGVAQLRFVTPKLSLQQGAPNAVYQHAMIIHAKADDHTSQPAGNAGSRIACGIVNALSYS